MTRTTKARAKQVSNASAQTTKSTVAKSVERPRPGRRVSLPGDALSQSAHVTLVGGNVFADLGFPAEEAENLKIRARLMDHVRALIQTRQLTQAAAGELFGVAQPRISDIRRGKIGLFTIDALINMLVHAGLRVRVELETAENLGPPIDNSLLDGGQK